MEKRQQLSFSEGTVWLDEATGFVRVEMFPGTRQTLKGAKEQIACVKEITQGVPRPMIVDLRSVHATDKDARAYFGSPESKATWTAVAMLTGTPLSNAIANVWIAVHASRNNPVKLFTSEGEAVAWLRGVAR